MTRYSSENNKMELSQYNNEWFSPTIGASKWKQALWYVVNAIFFINPLNPSSALKVWLLRSFGATVKKGAVIKPAVNIKYPWKLTIGENCWIGEKVWIDNLGFVTLGNNVCISQGAMLLTGNHNFTKSAFDLIVQPIALEEGVWVGANAIVCPGTICKSHAVITVGSVASGELSEYKIYKGNPAVIIKQRIIQA